MCGESHGIVNTRFLVATPGVQDGYVNITTMPDEERTATIPTPKDVKTGMIMAIGLGYYNDKLTIVAGYESGHVAVWHQIPQSSHWQTVYVNKSHSQPILSLDICDQHQCFFTSSTDAVITRHPFPGSTVETKSTQTGHAGQQSLKVRSDQKLFATAGWDSRVRVYSVRTSKELAVLKWHKEGCYALAFANISAQGRDEHESTSEVAPDEQRSTISQQRVQKAQTTHWLAAGSKDGKISLWDVY
jgi:WD40 repeat protein